MQTHKAQRRFEQFMINVLGHKFSECQHRYKMAYRSIQLGNG